MTPPPADSVGRGAKILLLSACFVIACAGIRYASSVIVPVLASLFIAAVSVPPVYHLERRGIPRWAAATIVLVSVLGALLITGLIAADAVNTFTLMLPEYTSALKARTGWLEEWIGSPGKDASSSPLARLMDPESMMGLLGTVLGALVGVLRDGAFVFVMTCFILAEAAGLPAKVRAAFPGEDGSGIPWRSVIEDMSTYLLVKVKSSTVVALPLGALLWSMSVPYALALTLLAFLMNFVPVFGAVIAAIPAVLLALVEHGTGSAIVVACAYAAINGLVGTLLEPRWMGRQLGISVTVVFLSLVFWGYLLGVVGMLLALPLTMLAKILLDHTNDMRWLSVLLGPPPKEPA